MKKINVLEAITSARLGGADIAVLGICRALSRLDARVQLFCPAGRPVGSSAADQGIRTVSWRTHGKLDLVTVLRLASLMKRSGIDVIHTHLSTASLLGAFAARLAGKASVAHVHGLNKITCFNYSTLVVAVSEAVKQHVCSQGLSEARVRVVHNGVDLSQFSPSDSCGAELPFASRNGTPLFSVFGRLSEEKGQRVALGAMSILLKDYPDAKLALAGEGPDLGELQAAAEALGISSSVYFTGFLPNVRGLMLASNAVIVPSLKEGFGLVAIEAMALARPLVATSVGGLAEVVLDRETGLVVPPNDPSAMARSMKSLIEDRALAERMGRRGRERVADCFELESQTRALLSILREAAGRPSWRMEEVV